MAEQATADSEPKKLIFNSAMSLISRGGNLVGNTVILLLIAYWRTPEQVGAYSLAVKYAALALGFALLGLDSLMIRDVAQEPRQARNYAKNLGLLRFLVSVLVLIGLTLFVYYVPDYTPRTRRVVILFALNLIPQGLFRLLQSTLIALNAYGLLALLGMASAVLALPLGAGALWLGASLEWVVVLQLFANWFALLIAWIPFRRQLQEAASTYGTDVVERLNLAQARRWLHATRSFAVIDGLFTIDWQVDVVLLSFLASERQVGLYGTAQAIMSILMLLLYSVDVVAYQLASRVVLLGRARTRWVFRRLLTLIAASVIPLSCALAVGFTFVIPSLLKEDFGPVLVPLYWLIGTWAVYFLNVPAARVIISWGQQRLVAIGVALSLLFNVSISLWLIPTLGIQAPAMARAISAVAYALLCTGAVVRGLGGKRTAEIDNLPSLPA